MMLSIAVYFAEYVFRADFPVAFVNRRIQQQAITLEMDINAN